MPLDGQDGQQDDGDLPPTTSTLEQQQQHRPSALHIPKNRGPVTTSSSSASLQVDHAEALKRLSIDGSGADPYDTRCVVRLGRLE